jgi:hypothetical protein
MYTYFIITPGAEVKSYVQYNGGQKGNYVKFGEASDLKEGAGIRQAYLTHNPDIGVAALMLSSVFTEPYLGTRLKSYIKGRGYDPVGTSEWFSIKTASAWGLFAAMQDWDKKTLKLADLDALKAIIDKHFP